MASGTINLTSDISTLKGKIEWSSTSNGSAANSSKVTATLYIARTDSYTTYGDWDYGFNVGGVTDFNSAYKEVSSSWVAVKTITNNSVAHNPDGTGTCYIEAYCTGPAGTSMEGHGVSGKQTVNLDRIPRYATVTQSLNSKTVNSIKMNWSSDSTIDYIWYSTNNGSSWTAVGSVNASSGNYTISGLSANTTYNIKTRVRRKDSQLTTDSSALSVATYQIATISSASNFNHGDNSSLVVVNPSGAAMTLQMKIGSTQIFSKSISAGTVTNLFTDSQLDTIYRLYGTGNSLTVTYIVSITVNGTTYTNSKTCTVTLTGNQKTGYVGQGGVKRAKLYVGVNGSVKRAVLWVGNNNTRKRCI